MLREAGHVVSERELSVPLGAKLAGLAIWCAGPEMDARRLTDRSRLGKAVTRQAAVGRFLLRAGLVRDSAREAWRSVAGRFFEDADVLLTPGLAQLPPPAVRWGERGWLANVRASSSYAPFGGRMEPRRLAGHGHTGWSAHRHRDAALGAAGRAARGRGAVARRCRAARAAGSMASGCARLRPMSAPVSLRLRAVPALRGYSLHCGRLRIGHSADFASNCAVIPRAVRRCVG